MVICDLFPHGNRWLDKLGLVAYHHQKIFRQDLIGGNYGLIESSENPLPVSIKYYIHTCLIRLYIII